ncbi:MAG: glycosyltransferase family 9 protein [Candidatus Binatia bacterium]
MSNQQALVIFPGALGDFICFVPALRELARRAGATPTLLVKESLAPLVREAGIAAPRAIEGREGSWLFSADPPPEAREFFGRFAVVECFTGHGVPEVEANLRRSGAAHVGIHPFRPPSPEHIAAHFLRCIGAATTPLPEVHLELPRARASAPRVPLNRKPALVVHPGSGGVVKRWSREGFARIASTWARERGDAVVILGPAESAESPFWEASAVMTAVGLDLPGLASALAGAELYLGNDSGASHLAGALGMRGIVVFGPTAPELWRPLSSRLSVFRPKPWTRLDEAAPEEVIRSLDRELTRAHARTSP